MYVSGTPFLQEKIKYKNEWKIMVEKQTAAREGKSNTLSFLFLWIQSDAFIFLNMPLFLN